MPFDPEALEMLSGRHVGVFSTLVKGGPALACVWYGIDGDDLIVSTPAGQRKDKNVQADPRVALLVDVRDGAHVPGQTAYRGVEVRGDAATEPDPGGRLQRKIWSRYLDTLPPDFEARMNEQDRTIIRIRPTKVRTWDHARGRR